MRQGPLAGRYPAVAAMVMLALIPYLALSGALGPITPIIGQDLQMSEQTLSLSSGLANAAYAVGTVLAVQFAQHLPQRRMLVGYAALGVLGGIVSIAFCKLLLSLRSGFLRLSQSTRMLQPAIGGLSVGLIGYFVPEVMGVGCNYVEKVLNGDLVF